MLAGEQPRPADQPNAGSSERKSRPKSQKRSRNLACIMLSVQSATEVTEVVSIRVPDESLVEGCLPLLV